MAKASSKNMKPSVITDAFKGEAVMPDRKKKSLEEKDPEHTAKRDTSEPLPHAPG
jgi:hypothetical protein